MENSRIIERYGGVTKEEPLTTLDSKLVMANTQVMESKTPFSGYYNDGLKQKQTPTCILFWTVIILLKPFYGQHIMYLKR
jgi:hypothetical protein